MARLPASSSGGGRNRAASTTLNTAVVPPIPSAIEPIAAAVTIGVRRRFRLAKRKSATIVSKIAGIVGIAQRDRNRTVPLNVRTVICDSPAPRLILRLCGLDDVGRA